MLTLIFVLSLQACTPREGARGTECIAPANAGGGWDLSCRLIARSLEATGVVSGPVRTLNMPGAGGGVAFAHAVSRRAGDASVLFAASTGTTLRLAQGQFGPLDAEDVRWVGALGAEYGIVAVAADAPWDDLGELLGAWRERPEGIVVSGGSAVVGQDHVKVLLLARAAGIDPLSVRYVPFDGGGEALTALLGGFVQVFSGDASEVEAYLETGAIRVLAVLAPEPLGGMLEGVPTARGAGYPVEWITWRGYYVPTGLGEDGYQRWVTRLDSVGRSSAWSEALRTTRLRPFHLVGVEFERFIMAQVAEFEELVGELGIGGNRP